METSGWKRGDPIGYIRAQIPEFAVPEYAGERYTALVPDTFDLQERAMWAVNVLTRATDPDADYEQYSVVHLERNPPAMQHEFSDQCQNKFMEALPLMRIVSGSTLNTAVDRRWMEVALRSLGPDGIAYTPLRGRPWGLAGASGWHINPLEGEQIIEPFWGGRMLSAMMLYGHRDGGPLWRREAERMVDGLASLAVDRGRYAFFAPSTHYAERGNTSELGRTIPLLGAHVAFVALGLTHTFRETGYEPALRLAGKLLAYSLDELGYFGEDGRFVPDQPQELPGWSHFHMHTYTLIAMLEYARATEDAALVERVRRGFEFGRSRGNRLLGYFPEATDSWELEQNEACATADMIALGLKLSAGGIGDYWDDVDRWTRNMFAEAQLSPAKAAVLDRRAAEGPRVPHDEMRESVDRVAERCVGAFASVSPANDWGTIVVQCCTGNGTRALYYLWEHSLTCEGGRLRVNLLLNRASPWADVDSHIPYAGQVDVRIKQPVDLEVRIPEWVRPAEVRVTVNGVERAATFGGRYAGIGAVRPGDVATLSFPIAERTEKVWIEKDRYTLVIKGNEVVAIDPAGANCPLYQREHYRAESTRWRTMERFVSGERIYW